MPHNREKTHCPQGHKYTKGNTAVYHRITNGHPSTFRICKTCTRQRRRWRAGVLAGLLLVGGLGLLGLQDRAVWRDRDDLRAALDVLVEIPLPPAAPRTQAGTAGRHPSYGEKSP